MVAAGSARGNVRVARFAGGGGSTLGAFALHCRGDVRLYCGTTDCTPKSKKGRALLAVLAAEQRPLSRLKIIDLLWSDRQEEQARASLRTLLADLKEQFGEQFEELLIVDRERIALASGVRTDLTDPALARPAGELFEGLDHIDPELDDWLRVERAKWESVESLPQKLATPMVREPARWSLTAFIAVLLFAITAVTLLQLKEQENHDAPVVAVLKFRDLTGRNALLAEGLAEEIRIQLAQHPRIRVIGAESSEAPSITAAELPEIRRKLGATHVVEGSLITRDEQPFLNVRLLNANGELVWTQLARAEGTWVRTGSASIAARISGNINETVAQGAGEAFEADSTAWEHVFSARRATRGLDLSEILNARTALRADVDRYPNFAPALASLAETSIYASDHPFYRGPIPLARARKEAAYFARRAILAAPTFGPGYAALGFANTETGAALEPLRRAVELSPGSYEAQHRLARSLELIGDYELSLRHQRLAAVLQPLDTPANFMLVRMLHLTGRTSEIAPLVRSFVRRTDERLKQLHFIAGVALEIGDISKAVGATRELLRLDPTNSQGHRLMMWNDIYLGDRRGALSHAVPDSITAILLQDDLPGLVRKLRQLGDDFWSLDWEANDAADYLYRRGRSDLLLELYDSARSHSSGSLPTDYSTPDAVALALYDVGRTNEARRLWAKTMVFAKRIGAARPSAYATALKGSILMMSGDTEEGLDLLGAAERSDWWVLQSGVLPIEQAARFRNVRDDARFKKLLDNYYANIAREKREVASDSLMFRNQPTTLVGPI